jgi:hypothetical protein
MLSGTAVRGAPTASSPSVFGIPSKGMPSINRIYSPSVVILTILTYGASVRLLGGGVWSVSPLLRRKVECVLCGGR